MKTFTGTAILEMESEAKPVHLRINLDENVIEVRFPMGARPELRRDWSEARPRLRGIHVELPTGRLIRDEYDDFFVSGYSPGTVSIHDAELVRALNLRAREEGITKLVLVPRSSGVEFEYQPSDGSEPGHEIVYEGCVVSSAPQVELQLSDRTFTLAGDKKGLVLRSREPLEPIEDRFRFCWSVVQGAPLSVRSILDNNRLILNLALPDKRSSHGRLYQDHNDLIPFLNAFFKFVQCQSETGFSRWQRSAHFYLEGISGSASLDINTLNLFVFLEMIDESKTLNKTPLAAALGICLEDADLLCRARNQLVHKGSSLGRAVIDSRKEVLGQASSWASGFDVFEQDEWATAALFHFRLAALLACYWTRRINCPKPCNEYREILASIRGRAKA